MEIPTFNTLRIGELQFGMNGQMKMASWVRYMVISGEVGLAEMGSRLIRLPNLSIRSKKSLIRADISLLPGIPLMLTVWHFLPVTLCFNFMSLTRRMPLPLANPANCL